MPDFTQKQWRDPVPDYSNSARFNINTDDGYLVASVLGKENAEHILACVRACRGLDADELLLLGLGGIKVSRDAKFEFVDVVGQMNNLGKGSDV